VRVNDVAGGGFGGEKLLSRGESECVNKVCAEEEGKVPRGEESWTRSTCSFRSGALGKGGTKGRNEGGGRLLLSSRLAGCSAAAGGETGTVR
jgi:hypothetical protein